MASAATASMAATSATAMPTAAATTAMATTSAVTATTSVSAVPAVTSATRATATSSSAGWQNSPNSLEAAEKEYGRWEHRAVQSIQRCNFLILGFGGVRGRVALLSRHHRVAVELGLMALINA
jgi:hypothetical protein